MNKIFKICHGLAMKICSAIIFVMFVLIAVNADGQRQKSKQQQFEALAKPMSTVEWLDIKDEISITHDEFLTNFIQVLGLVAGSEMKLVRSESDEIGFTHYRYQQYLNNVKVFGGEMVIHENSGRVTSVNGKYLQQAPANTIASVGENSALQYALKEIKSTDYLWLNPAAEQNYKDVHNDQNATMYPKGELVYVRTPKFLDPARPYYLGWKFDINVNPMSESYTVFVNAYDGKIISKIPLALDCSSGTSTTLWNGARTIYTQFVSANNNYRSIDDCQATTISTRNGNGNNNGTGFGYYTDADNAWSTSALQEYVAQTHYGVKQTYNYYLGVHSRTSYNNAGQTMISYLNPGFTGNAYWTTATQAASFGGSSTGGSPYTTLDVNGHEHSHGVTEHTCGLVYQDESGALNESFSDIFGEMVESWALGTPDWIHRAEIGGGNRSFINPNAKSQPDTYLGTYWCDYTNSGLSCTSNDAGGVHTNSGVQNYWFYLLSEGGSGTNDNGLAFNIAGIGRFDARDICYRALTLYLNSTSEFIDSRAATLHAAYDLFGGCSAQIIAVGDAWRAVGVESQSGQYNNSVACGNWPANGTYSQAIHQLSVASSCAVNITVSATTVYFSAKDRVIMYPGFTAVSGSNFYAYLEPCAITLWKGSGPKMSDAERGIIENQQLSNNSEFTSGNDISVAPNPAKDLITLSFVLPTESAVKIELFDALGNRVALWDEYESLSHGMHNMTYETSQLTSGIYFVSVNINGQSHNKKIVKTD